MRDNWININICRKSPEEVEEQSESSECRQYRAHVLLMEMFTEVRHVTVVVAVAIDHIVLLSVCCYFRCSGAVITYDDVRYGFNFGYRGADPVNVELLLISAAMQLVMEVLVDLVATKTCTGAQIQSHHGMDNIHDPHAESGVEGREFFM